MNSAFQISRKIFPKYSRTAPSTRVDGNSHLSAAPSFALVRQDRDPLSKGEKPAVPLTDEQKENLAIMNSIPSQTAAPVVETTNYPADNAIREGTLAPRKAWKKQSGRSYFTSSKGVRLELGTMEDPILADNAERLLGQRNVQSVMVARIIMGLWWSRRNDPSRSTERTDKGTNTVAMRLDEILDLLGYEKTTDSNGYSDGYDSRAKHHVQDALSWLSRQWLKGQVTIIQNKGTRKEKILDFL